MHRRPTKPSGSPRNFAPSFPAWKSRSGGSAASSARTPVPRPWGWSTSRSKRKTAVELDVVARQRPDPQHGRRHRDESRQRDDHEPEDPTLGVTPRKAVLLAQLRRKESGGHDLERNHRGAGHQPQLGAQDETRQLRSPLSDANFTLRHHPLQVGTEVGVGRRKSVAWNAEQLSEHFRLLIEILALSRRQRFHERLVGHERRIDQRRVNPSQEV